MKLLMPIGAVLIAIGMAGSAAACFGNAIFDRADIELWASDFSPAALEKASRGFYRERSFRSLSPALPLDSPVPTTTRARSHPE